MVTNEELLTNCRYDLLSKGYLKGSQAEALLKLSEHLVDDDSYAEHLEEDLSTKDDEIARLKKELAEIKDIAI